ncbi:MAG: DUF1302 family protein [Myxococcota bacterium]
MRRSGVAVAAALLAAASARAETPLEISALLESDSAWRIHSPRQLQKSQTRLELDAALGLSPALELRATGRAIWDPAGRLVGEHPDPDYEPIDRGQIGGNRHLEVELRELYLDWHGRVADARLDVRAGKQQIVWGQSFGLRVLDFVNPQDFREFILDEYNDSRIPTFALRGELAARGFTLQGIVVPDFEPDQLPALESEFSLEQAVPGFLPGLAPLPEDPVFAGGGPILIPGRDEQPHDWRTKSLAWGVRLGTSARGFDVALYYWDRIDPSPVFRRSVESLDVTGFGPVPVNVVDTDYARVRSVGLSFARPLGEVSVWGEGALSYGRAYALEDVTDSDGWVSRPDLQYALGLDWNAGESWFVNAQWIQFVRMGPSHGIEVDRARSFASLLVRGELLAETVVPQVFVLYGANEREAMVRPSLEWRATDRLSLAVGVDLFSGPRAGMLGQYAHERECARIPAAVPVPGAGTCGYDPPEGETSRVFLRLRYAFLSAL